MFIPGNHDTVMYRGVMWTFRVQWLITDDETPADLTGWEGVLRIKTRKQATESLLELTTSNGRLELTATGDIVARLDNTLVDTLPLGSLWYELEVSSADEQMQLLHGHVKVEP